MTLSPRGGTKGEANGLEEDAGCQVGFPEYRTVTGHVTCYHSSGTRVSGHQSHAKNAQGWRQLRKPSQTTVPLGKGWV